MSDNLRVTVAAVVGTSATATNGFFEGLGPGMDVLLTVGQVGVAAVTILYIYQKWRNSRKKNPPKD